jgi:hypothetical protein
MTVAPIQGMRKSSHTKRYQHDNDREPQAKPRRDRGREDIDDQDDGTQVKNRHSREEDDADIAYDDGEDHTLERLASDDLSYASGPDA